MNFRLSFKKEFLQALGFNILEVKFLNQRWDEREKVWKNGHLKTHHLVYLSDEIPEELKEYKTGIVETKTDYEITVGNLCGYNLEIVFVFYYEKLILSQLNQISREKLNEI